MVPKLEEESRMVIVEWLVNLAGIYFFAGLLFGAAFVARGVQVIDPVAKGSGAGFRLIILPGAVALWPFLLRRWIRARR
jgi:hypothetical protein